MAETLQSLIDQFLRCDALKYYAEDKTLYVERDALKKQIYLFVLNKPFKRGDVYFVITEVQELEYNSLMISKNAIMKTEQSFDFDLLFKDIITNRVSFITIDAFKTAAREAIEQLITNLK